jgi:hypothetical protein
MDKLLLGCLLGVLAGGIAVALMLPMKFPDRRAALLGAFCNRFLIGFVVGAAVLPLPALAGGALIGFLVSLPDAIITKAYAPILILGTVFGGLIGLAVKAWGT